MRPGNFGGLLQAAAHGRREVVQALLAAGAFKQTPISECVLAYMARNGRLEIVERLLDAGLDPRKYDDDFLRSAAANREGS